MVRACPVAGQAAQCGQTTVSNFSSAITYATLPANGARDEDATSPSGTGFTHRSPLAARRNWRTPCYRNAALGGNQYLSPRSESLMDPAGRVFPNRTRWRYSTHTNRCSVLLSISVAVLVPKNFRRSSRPPCHIRALYISGHFSGGASSRRHGVRTVRMLVYCPKGDMTWHLAP